MCDPYVFSRYKANDIRSELQNAELKRAKTSGIRRKLALKKIIANLTLGNYAEMIQLFPDILKFWKIEDDFEVKRICHEYVRTIGSIKPRSVVEALPNILDDLKSHDENEQILALETLINVPFTKFTDEAFRFIICLVNRRSVSSRVLKTAIYSLLQLNDLDHERVMSLTHILYEIVEQHLESPSVQVAALKTLYSLLDNEKNMDRLSLSIDVAYSLLDNIPSLNEWDILSVLECLAITVVPRTHSDAYKMIDIVLPQLQHVNTSVALSSLRFILYLINYVDEIDLSLTVRLSNSVIALLEKPTELQFLVLRNIILLLLSREKPIIDVDASYFFIEFNDPIYIKDTKLECLYLLANETNLAQILEELEQYSTDIDIQMSRKAVRAIGNLAVKLGEAAADSCVATLLHLVGFGVDYVIQETIAVFRNILRKYPNRYKEEVVTFTKYMECIQEAEAKNAIIWIISNYSDILDNYAELFENFVSNIKDEQLEVQFTILNASVKLFVKTESPHIEAICNLLFRFCTEETNNPDLRSRAFMYSKLLSTAKERPDIINQETLKDFLNGEMPVIELNSKLDPVILEELELNIGTVTSVYLKPTVQIFKESRIKTLPESPVLHADKNTLQITQNKELLNDTFTGANSNISVSSKDVNIRRSSRNATMGDYDRPAQKINQLKGKRKSSVNLNSHVKNLSRKPSMLIRKLSLKRND